MPAIRTHATDTCVPCLLHDYRVLSTRVPCVCVHAQGVHLYDAAANSQRGKYHHKAAVLDCCLENDSTAYSGGLDRSVMRYDFSSETPTSLGEHGDAVRCVDFSADHRVLVTGSWDKTAKLWDPRAATALQASVDVPGKVYTQALGPDGSHLLIVGTADRHVQIFDLRSLAEPLHARESSLKFQTRCIRAFTTGDGYALSSIEGRVAMEYISSDDQSKKYAFKCHRQKVAGKEHVFPVNALAFNKRWGTFATGGCDGFVNIWDGQHKKRLCQLPKFAVGVASMDFNHDGSLLAIATSYTFEEGDVE